MAFAELNLGLLYAAGRGFRRTTSKTMTWLQLSLFSLPRQWCALGSRSGHAGCHKMTSEKAQDAKERADVEGEAGRQVS